MLSHCLVSLLLVCLYMTNIITSSTIKTTTDASTTSSTIKYSPISSMIPPHSIVGADNFVHLFVWNDLNIRTIEDFMVFSATRREPLRIFSYSFDRKFMENLFGMFMPAIYGNGSFYGNYVQLILRELNTECLQGSVFENFDALLDVPYEFTKRIRTARTHQQKRKHSNEYLNPSDFTIIPLFPQNVYLSNYTDNINDINAIIQQNTTIINMTCSDSILHDWRLIEMLHGTLNVTTDQLKLMNVIYKTDIRMNYTLLNQIPIQYLTNQQVQSFLWPSSCHFCLTQSCVAENWKWYDSVDMVGIGLGVCFYVALFASGSFKLPMIRRRLGIPILIPFLVMLILVSYLNAFNSGCISLSAIGSLYGASTCTLIYAFTVLRYYYLKNLYSFIRNSKRPRMHKTFSSTWFGILITIVLPFFICIFLLAAIIPFFPSYNIYTWNLTGTSILGVLIAVSCFLGISCLLIDAFINRKGIREKGWRRFLLFDDPWFIRIDLSFLSMILILLIALIICYLFIPSSMAVYRLAIGICVYLICGGNAMIISAYQRIDTKNRISNDSNDDFLERLVLGEVNVQGYSLFKEYCEKELSLENIMLMEVLVSVKKRQTPFNLKVLNDIFHTHLDTNSLYSVNIPHRTKEDLVKFISKYGSDTETETSISSNQHTENWNILNPLYLDILDNFRDTFSRFRNTREFTEWNKIYVRQQELHVI